MAPIPPGRLPVLLLVALGELGVQLRRGLRPDAQGDDVVARLARDVRDGLGLEHGRRVQEVALEAQLPRLLGDEGDGPRGGPVRLDQIGLVGDEAEQRRPEVLGAALVVLLGDELHALALHRVDLRLDQLAVVLAQLVVGSEKCHALGADLLDD